CILHCFSSQAVSDLIAIGTLHGLILIFDPKQALKLCLGSTAHGAQYGAITALTFNNDCTRLLCGFAKGQIIVWDSGTGKLLRTITDAHPPGSAVLSIKLLVVGLKPSFNILYRSPYGKAQPSSVPVLAWQFVWTQERVDPVLAFCRGSKIIFFHLNCAGDQIEFASLMEIDLQYEIINLKWVNSRTLLLQDGLDKLHVIDRESCEELDSHSLADVHLVRSCSYFDSSESKQTISPTMREIQQKACYQSIWTYGGQTVFLGAKVRIIVTVEVGAEGLGQCYISDSI
uniref:Uncharacterized protein n=1 Tax=Callorhinchus milii TaxID=7868 RepID=A0A4W3J0L1_CALMI